MKRRSAAALLLTLGLTVGGNGTVVFAAETPVETQPAEIQQETEKEEKPDAGADESRIVSFTDYTGMKVTYDANVSHHYVYEVEDAVLTGVKYRTTDADGGETLEAVSFEGNVELKQPEEGEKYTSVAADVFGGNPLITYVKLPAGVAAVAENGFKDCTGLKSVYLPSTVEEIGAGAFEGCTAMTQLSLPKSVTVIGERAFKGDKALQTVQFRDMADMGQLSVGAHAFEGCAELEEINVETKNGG